MSIAAAPPRPVDRSLVREEIYIDLRRRIVEGTLPPGEVLRDKEIASNLGVSRTPVREAIRRLEDEGLVETASSRWTRVAPLDVEHALETYAIIKTLEVLSLRRAWRSLGDREVRGLVMFNNRMLEARRRGDPRSALAADSSFHNTWIARSDNSELVRLLFQIKLRLRRLEIAYFTTANRVSTSYDEHFPIIEAFEAHSLARAVTALKRDWQSEAVRMWQASLGSLGPRPPAPSAREGSSS